MGEIQIRRKKDSNATLCLFGTGLFAMFGLFLFPAFAWTQAGVEARLKWPFAEAEIVTHQVSHDGSRPRSGGGGYSHKLAYRFDVQGRSYTGDQASYGSSPPTWETEAQARSALPDIGSKIQVRYNPADPRENVIHVIPNSTYEWVLLWSAAILGLVGAGFMVVGGLAWRAERKVAEANPTFG